MTEKNPSQQPILTSYSGNLHSSSLGPNKPIIPLGKASSHSRASSPQDVEDIVNRLIVYFKKNLK